ncbi:MAG: U32 family peptidase [Lachnospiraceae bacterium]|nr:U32 family peptidase [Lachnospiraceae bacterium]
MTELLAPAGSLQALRAAVDAGADAVYIGGRMFGARAYADNPDEPELLEGIEYCHLRGRKMYLTVNTLLKENELRERLVPFLEPLYRHGLDALIVQDLGVLRAVREHFPNLELHASTQMSVTTPEGAALLARHGVCRVVPARELSLREIEAIVHTGIEVETFVHGAMCYCYSGRCLLSSMLGGRSGNRGRCAQPCRLPYAVEMNEPSSSFSASFPLSMRDMCTLDILPDLMDAGIASFKIEGRMKRPEYSAGVTAIYRKYMDAYQQNGREHYHVREEDRRLLSDLFDRGYSGGYYQCYNGSSMIAKQRPKAEGADEGWQKNQRNQSLLSKENSKVKINGDLRILPGIPVILELWPADDTRGGRFDVTVSGEIPQLARTNAASLEDVARRMKKTGDTPFEFEELNIELADGLFLPVHMLNELRREALTCLREKLLQERNPRTARSASNASDTLNTLNTQSASNASNTLNIQSAPNASDTLNIQSAPNASDASNTQSASDASNISNKQPAAMQTQTQMIRRPKLTIMVTLRDQLSALLRWQGLGSGQTDTVYLDSMLLGSGREIADNCRTLLDAAAALHDCGIRCFFAFPPVLRERGRVWLEHSSVAALFERMDGFLVQSMDELAWLKEHSCSGEIAAEDCLYSFNRPSREELRREGIARFSLPAELNARELRALGDEGCELVLYGYQPLMQSAQCVRKTMMGCRWQKQETSGSEGCLNLVKQESRRHGPKESLLYLRDRKNVRFPVMTRCLFCTNTVYNSVPLRLGGYTEDIRKINPSYLRISFTIESGEETARILEFYRQMPELCGKDPSAERSRDRKKPARSGAERNAISDTAGTRGHFKRGVE